MAGRLYHPLGTTSMVILFALVVIRRIDGTPYRSPGYYSYDDESQAVPGESPNPSFTLPGPPNSPTNSAETAEEVKTVHYSESSTSYEDGRRESRGVELSQQERAIKMGNKHNSHDDLGRHTGADYDDEDDDNNDDDDDDDSDDNDDDNHSNNNNTGITEEEITQLIDDAFQDDIFLSPKKWAAWLGSTNDGSSSVKVQKTRSPASSHDGVTQTTAQHAQRDRIVFPDEYPSRIANDNRPVPRCPNSTFCVEPEYYLSDAEIENALKLRYLDPISEPSTISERMGPLDEGNGLCPSTMETLLPKTGLSDDDEWYWILNNEKYVQSIRIEVCKTEEQPCDLIEGFAAGYKTACKQKFVYRQLVAVSQKGGPATTKPFQMKSSCCCHVKFTGDPEMRLGVSPSKSNQYSPIPERRRN